MSRFYKVPMEELKAMIKESETHKKELLEDAENCKHESSKRALVSTAHMGNARYNAMSEALKDRMENPNLSTEELISMRAKRKLDAKIERIEKHLEIELEQDGKNQDSIKKCRKELLQLKAERQKIK